MNKILILAEHDGTTLNPGTAKAVRGAATVVRDRVGVDREMGIRP